tara:strand:+ start:2994 stop:3566 length:573 start_codon:yes stop_codon:yes gene_type:complete
MSRETKKVDYSKIGNAISGRSLVRLDPNIETKRKAQLREIERKASMSFWEGIAGFADLGAMVGENIETWDKLEAGYKAVQGDNPSTLEESGLKTNVLQRMFTAAPAGGAFTVTQKIDDKDVFKVFTGTELSNIGTAIERGFGHTIGEAGKTYFESFGGTLSDSVDIPQLGYSEEGFKPEDISSWISPSSE